MCMNACVRLLEENKPHQPFGSLALSHSLPSSSSSSSSSRCGRRRRRRYTTQLFPAQSNCAPLRLTRNSVEHCCVSFFGVQRAALTRRSTTRSPRVLVCKVSDIVLVFVRLYANVVSKRLIYTYTHTHIYIVFFYNSVFVYLCILVCCCFCCRTSKYKKPSRTFHTQPNT